jgi:membrane-bound metal-dependent hydrolase YbcI (DUF457 family)
VTLPRGSYVDVVSHLAFGRALVALAHRPDPAGARGAKPPSRRALTAAIVIGSIAPDVDAILMPFGWDRYLVSHVRGTHTLPGALIVAAFVASVIRFVAQPLLRRPRTPWRLLWLAAIAGCGSHLVLDAVSGGTLHLLWPLSDAHLSFSLVAMADPVLAAPLLLFLIVAWIWRRLAFHLTVAILIVMIAVLTAKGVSRHAAAQAYRGAVTQPTALPNSVGPNSVTPNSVTPNLAKPPTRPLIEARWASLSDWYIYDRTVTSVRAWRVNASTGRVEPYIEHILSGALTVDEAALIDASRRLDTVKRALSLFDFTFPDVIQRNDGTVDVLWSDISFCRPGACDLRFGGQFDRSGRALEQIVVIGTVRQTRAAVP